MTDLPKALEPLTTQPHWLVWKLEIRGKGNKSTKVPYQTNGRFAKSTDPKTWCSYEEAQDAAPRFDGIGFALLNTGIAAFDLDDCRNAQTGEVDPWAQDLVTRAGSYTEVTPSGTGLRILGYGNGPKVHTKKSVPNANGTSCEIYRQAERYITVSGNV
jgi:primase-polymerase (primpol)-like protein